METNNHSYKDDIVTLEEYYTANKKASNNKYKKKMKAYQTFINTKYINKTLNEDIESHIRSFLFK